MSRPRFAGDRIMGALLAGVGLAVAAEASTFEVAFVTDPVGPKALPLLAAATFLLAGVRSMWRPQEPVAAASPAAGLRVAGAAAAFFAYALALPVLGFFVATTGAVAALSVLFGGRPRHALVAAAALSAALWLLFVQALALPLPIGSLWMR